MTINPIHHPDTGETEIRYLTPTVLVNYGTLLGQHIEYSDRWCTILSYVWQGDDLLYVDLAYGNQGLFSNIRAIFN